MRLALKIHRFRLWRVVPNHYLHQSLTDYLEKIADYFAMPLHCSFDLAEEMSFLDALCEFCKRCSFKALALERDDDLFLGFPLIARDRHNDRAVLLIPCGPKTYMKFDHRGDAEALSIAAIRARFDEFQQIALINDESIKMGFQHMAKTASSFLPMRALIILAIALVIFLAVFLALGFNEFSKPYQPILTIALIFDALLILLLFKHARWLSMKNYGFSAIMLMHDFYQRMFSLTYEKFIALDQKKISYEIMSIRYSIKKYFHNRLNEITATIILLGMLLIIFIYSEMRWFIIIFCCALAWMTISLRHMLTSARKIKQVYEGEVDKTLSDFALSHNALLGLHATKPLINQLLSSKDQLIRTHVRMKKISFIFHGLRLLMPMLCVFLLALWFSHNEALLPWHIMISVVGVLVFGFAAAYLGEKLELTTLPVTAELIKEIDLWPLELRGAYVKPVAIIGAIELINVSFSYGDHGALIVKNGSFYLEAQGFHLIYGRSGSGKSTLLRLLMGMVHPQSGQIIFDGQDGRSLELSSLRKNFGVVLDNSQLFPGSIFENIMCGRNLSKTLIEKLFLSHEIFDNLIDLPMGLETYIFWHGKNISRFERSLILLARALVHEPKVLFMDEILNGLTAAHQINFLTFLSTLNMTRILTSHEKYSADVFTKNIEINQHNLTQNQIEPNITHRRVS